MWPRGGGWRLLTFQFLVPGHPRTGCLCCHIKPALSEVEETLDQISGQTQRPAGRVRLLIPRFAVPTVLVPKLGRLHKEFPDIVLEVTTDNNRRDIVAGGFDAGVNFGEFIEKGHDRGPG